MRASCVRGGVQENGFRVAPGSGYALRGMRCRVCSVGHTRVWAYSSMPMAYSGMGILEYAYGILGYAYGILEYACVGDGLISRPLKNLRHVIGSPRSWSRT